MINRIKLKRSNEIKIKMKNRKERFPEKSKIEKRRI
jgi:hypothetical protein